MTERALIASDRRARLHACNRFIAACLLALFGLLSFAAVASAETRTLKLYFVHTREKAEITYKRNGRYLRGGLNDINRFLRDWRRNEPTKMDPRLLDLLWEVYQKSGSRKHIHVISAYRSPATNKMLRKRGRGVAKKSQHTLGKAIDFYLPDVKLSKLRRIGLQMQQGGVGYYPRSGSPFVHMDVGSVRHWPRMSRRELVAMFPNGKTLHVPTDGKPLPGYKQALAAYNKRKKGGGSVVVASAEPAPKPKPRERQRDRDNDGGGFLSAFFSGGQNNRDDSVQAAPAPTRVKTIPAPAAADEQPKTPEMIIAALPARDVPLPLFAPRPQKDVGETNEAETANVPIPSEPVPSEPIPAEAAGEEAPALVALAVPQPTPRPAAEIEASLAARFEASEDAEMTTGTVVASAGKSGIEDALAIMRTTQPDDGRPDDGKGDRVASVPLPENRPARDDRAVVVAAALPDRGPVLDNSSARYGMPTLRETVFGADKERKDRLNGTTEPGAVASSPREFILASIEPIDPLEAVSTGIRTTEKAGKPDVGDQKPERQVMIVPLPENLSRRAFAKTHIARANIRTRAPSFAFNLVGRAPREIYTAGFSRTTTISNPYRFTGKAVQFLSVAKFN